MSRLLPMTRFRPRLIDALAGYDRARFMGDVGAGLTVAVVALPLAMAFAIASGLTPQAGLFTAIVAGLLISLLGGIVQARRFNPAEFAWQFANTVGADCYLLTAPAVVDSADTRRALIERCGLDSVLNRVEKMHMALMSVGTMSAMSTSFRFGFFSESERQSLIAANAVGDLLYNFFDANGRIVDHPINGRVMSTPIERLRKVPRRVMISGGLDKVPALIAGMKLAATNVLITNEETAKALLSHA